MEDINLIVKAPNQKMSDHRTQASSLWTVKQLKAHLSISYPTRPEPTDQRLIYSGHLLNNDQTLDSVFHATPGENVTIHMVCTQKATGNQPPSTSPSEAAPTSMIHRRVVSSPEATTSPSTSSSTSSPPPLHPELRESLMNFDPALNGIPQLTPEQLAIIQPLYNQFVSQINVEQLVTLTNQARVAAPAPQPPAPVPEEEGEENRDLLDWFYWLSRAAILLSIVYFYSSLTRFLFVVGIGVFLYLYQMGAVLPRNEGEEEGDVQRANREADMNPDQPPMNNNNNNNNNGQGEFDVVPPERPVEEAAAAVVPDPIEAPVQPPVLAPAPPTVAGTLSEPANSDRFAGLRLIWVIVSSLVTSLIPEQAHLH